MDADMIMQAVDESPRPCTPIQDREPCWVCLDEGEGVACQQLISPCRCPRAVHPLCLARWQLRSAGKGEETHCRFCRARLPDWRESMTPEDVRALRQTQRAPPAIMAVAFNGKVENVKVESGPEGYAQFLQAVRELFGITADLEMELTFDCAEPATGQPLVLNGGGAYHAAVHCAAVAAAQRQVPPPGHAGDRHRSRRARRNGFFVRAARAVTRSLRGSGPGDSTDAPMADGDHANEDSSSNGDGASVATPGPAGSEASPHLPPTEAHVALIHPATDSPMAPPPAPGSHRAGTAHSDAGTEPAAGPAQPLSPKAGLLPGMLLAGSVANAVS